MIVNLEQLSNGITLLQMRKPQTGGRSVLPEMPREERSRVLENSQTYTAPENEDERPELCSCLPGSWKNQKASVREMRF